jgi:hypothetical protein
MEFKTNSGGIYGVDVSHNDHLLCSVGSDNKIFFIDLFG